MLLERHDGFRILIDPFVKNKITKTSIESLYDVNLVLITHSASDHYGDAAEILRHNDAAVVCGGEVKYLLTEAGIEPARILKTTYGDRRIFGESGDIEIRTVLAHHHSTCKVNGSLSNWPPFGFTVRAEPRVTYYHTGDTALFSDMKLIGEQYKPDVMIVGISSIEQHSLREMTPKEAALAVSWVRPDVVIPSHYVPGSPDLEEFKAYMQYIAPGTIIKDAVDKPFKYNPFSVS